MKIGAELEFLQIVFIFTTQDRHDKIDIHSKPDAALAAKTSGSRRSLRPRGEGDEGYTAQSTLCMVL